MVLRFQPCTDDKTGPLLYMDVSNRSTGVETEIKLVKMIPDSAWANPGDKTFRDTTTPQETITTSR